MTPTGTVKRPLLILFMPALISLINNILFISNTNLLSLLSTYRQLGFVLIVIKRIEIYYDSSSSVCEKMVKPILVFLVAALLMASLDGVVCGKGFRSRLFGSKNSGKDAEKNESTPRDVAEIESMDPDSRSTEDWKTLRQNYINQLSDLSKTFNTDEVYELIEQLSETEKYAGHDRSFQYDVKDLVSMRHLVGCNNMNPFERALYKRDSGVHPSLEKYMVDCLDRYLEACKYNELFAQAVSFTNENGPEPWNSDKYSTLASLLREKFFHSLPPFFFQSQSKGGLAVSSLEAIVPLSDKSNIKCSDMELRASIVSILLESRINFPEMLPLVNAHFATYLSVCGLEDKFREAMNTNNIEIDVGKFALNTYLMGKFLKQVPHEHMETENMNAYNLERQMLFALELVDQFDDLSRVDESKCNQMSYINKLLDYNEQTATYPELHKFVSTILANQLKACETNFQNMAEKFQQKETESWNRIKHFTELSKQYFVHGNKYDNPSLYLMREAMNGAQSVIFREKKKNGNSDPDFKDKLRKSCEAFFDYMMPATYSLSFSMPAAGRDEKIKEILIDLDCCYQMLDRAKGDRNDPPYRDMFNRFRKY